MALKKLNDAKGAEASFSKALTLAPQDPLILINYAIFLEAEGQFKKARDILTVLNDVSVVIDVDIQVKIYMKQNTHIKEHKNYFNILFLFR